MESSRGTESPVLIRTYPELASQLMKMISGAKVEIYLAPRYYEPAIASKVLAKFGEGISVHILDSNACGVAFEERIRMAQFHDIKNRALMQKLLDTPNSIIRANRLDYSFIVVDRKYCGFELINPASPDNFYCAVKMDNSDLAKQLIDIFESFQKSQSGKAETYENVVEA